MATERLNVQIGGDSQQLVAASVRAQKAIDELRKRVASTNAELARPGKRELPDFAGIAGAVRSAAPVGATLALQQAVSRMAEFAEKTGQAREELESLQSQTRIGIGEAIYKASAQSVDDLTASLKRLGDQQQKFEQARKQQGGGLTSFLGFEATGIPDELKNFSRNAVNFVSGGLGLGSVYDTTVQEDRNRLDIQGAQIAEATGKIRAEIGRKLEREVQVAKLRATGNNEAADAIEREAKAAAQLLAIETQLGTKAATIAKQRIDAENAVAKSASQREQALAEESARTAAEREATYGPDTGDRVRDAKAIEASAKRTAEIEARAASQTNTPAARARASQAARTAREASLAVSLANAEKVASQGLLRSLAQQSQLTTRIASDRQRGVASARQEIANLRDEAAALGDVSERSRFLRAQADVAQADVDRQAVESVLEGTVSRNRRLRGERAEQRRFDRARARLANLGGTLVLPTRRDITGAVTQGRDPLTGRLIDATGGGSTGATKIEVKQSDVVGKLSEIQKLLSDLVLR